MKKGLIPGRALLTCVLIACPPFMMASPPQQTPGSVEGVVTTFNGRPLQGAQIQLNALTVETDDKGQFVITDVPPGKYQLRVQKPGYVVNPDPILLSNAATVGTFTLKPGERVTNLLIEMARTGTVRGKVTDSNGKPLSSVRIAGLTRNYLDSYPRIGFVYLPGVPIRTDERGEYIISSLPPGEYFLVTGDDYPGPSHPVTHLYFPGTRDPSKAGAIEVTEDREITNIDLVLPPGQSLAFTGKLTPDSPEVAATEVFSVPIPRGAALSMSLADAVADALTPPRQFSLRYLPLAPGVYDLFHFAFGTTMDYFGSTPVTVGDEPVKDLSIQLRPGVEIQGQVVLEGDASKVKLAAPPITLRSLMYDTASRGTWGRRNVVAARQALAAADLSNDGSFRLRSVPPGTFVIVPAVPPGSCLSDVVQEGKSILASGLTVSTTPPPPAEVHVTTECATLEGTVKTGAQPRSFTRVVLIPSGDRRRSYGLYKTATTDQNGRFSFTSVSPGDYKVFSWRSIPEGAWTNAEYISKYEDRGQAVDATRAGRVTNLELELIVD